MRENYPEDSRKEERVRGREEKRRNEKGREEKEREEKGGDRLDGANICRRSR